MPLRPEDEQHRRNLVAASDHLRTAGKEDLAASVDHVLSPQGVAFVGRLRVDRLETDPNLGDNVPMKVTESERDLLKNAAEASGRPLSSDATEGLQAFVAGDFMPQPRARARRNSGATSVSVVLNVRVDPRALKQAEARQKELKEAGTRVPVSTVVYDWLCRQHRVGPYAETTE
ncbi:hypothetical protein ACFQ6Q_00300 [Streptomyces sp. NPDC056437]|uniref:hypothetical protein n=1 Tax=Streptomyces sp. NPDC056437 TaxID=3345816 RepID=UPI0036B3C529